VSLVTVIIPTKNRKDDLKRAVASCLQQKCDLEVLVLDDGSTDGTVDLVEREFPSVRLYQGTSSRRQMYRRNQGARMSKSDFLVFIDDDCEFTSNDIIAKNLELFSDQKIAAVGMPLKNVKYEDYVRQKSPEEERPYIMSESLEGAMLVRRDIFNALGGYNSIYVREGEGADFAVRLLNAGYYIRAGFSDPIYHYHSPVRDNRLSHVYGPRNLILFAYLNVPLRYLFAQLSGSTLKAVYHGFKIGHPILKIYGIIKGYVACFSVMTSRKPVSVKTYRMYRAIKSRGMISLDSYS
jgi:glycosyltransferase involved in cell wall biosynthesis